jgi:transcriptional regulator with XRE-family HTH domain
VYFVFYDNFMLLCEKNQIRPYTALKNIGIESKSILSRWRAGATPRSTTVKMIADYFGATPEELLFGIKKEPSIPTDEELDKNDAMWEKREEISRMLPDLTSQQLSDIINYIENTNNPELNARYSELLKIASMMSSEKYQTVIALLKELL